jgi:UDP-GlcNAc:undecaprenyl-phosphate GlcNAc-1-phosphate transferase
MSIIAYGFVYILIGKAIIPGMLTFLRGHGLVRSNYEHEVIPTAFGLFLYSMLIIQSLLFALWPDTSSSYFEVVNPIWGPSVHLYLLWSGLIFWAGWVDDTKGDRLIKGFKGHIGSLLQDGIVTTGLVKAGMAGLVAVWVVVELGGSWYDRLIRFMVIVLSTNAVNLLDLRPGRAIKSFYLGSIMLFIGSESLVFLPYWLPLAIAALLTLPSDLSGRVMIGDTGANLLGFGLGFSLSVSAPNEALMVMSVLLIALHWKAERSSLTATIERNFVLNSIDQWGRLR